MKQRQLNKKMAVRKVTIANLENLQLNALRGGTDISDVVGVVCYPAVGTDKPSCSYDQVLCPPGYDISIDPCV